jgi:hypothetical protein
MFVFPLSNTLKSSVFPLSVSRRFTVEEVAPPPFTFSLPVGVEGAPIFSRTFESSHAKFAEAAKEPAGVELN